MIPNMTKKNYQKNDQKKNDHEKNDNVMGNYVRVSTILYSDVKWNEMILISFRFISFQPSPEVRQKNGQIKWKMAKKILRMLCLHDLHS